MWGRVAWVSEDAPELEIPNSGVIDLFRVRVYEISIFPDDSRQNFCAPPI